MLLMRQLEQAEKPRCTDGAATDDSIPEIQRLPLLIQKEVIIGRKGRRFSPVIGLDQSIGRLIVQQEGAPYDA